MSMPARGYLNIKKYVEEAWNKIQEPISLSDDPKSWLKIEPIEVQMTPLMGRVGLVQASIGMKANSFVHVGANPGSAHTPLGKLKLTRNETGSFSVSVVSDIGYKEADSLVKKYFEGQIYTFKNGKKKVKVDNVNLYGSGEKMVLALEISGSIKGKIFMKGIPYYDASSQSIKVKQVEFDVDTKNKLINSADWLAHDIFIKKIESTFAYPVRDELKEAQDLIGQSLTNNKITNNILLNGRLSDISIKGIYLTEESIKAVVVLKGALNVEILNLD